MIVFERHDLSKELFRGLEFERWFYIFIQVPFPRDLIDWSTRYCKYSILPLRKEKRH